MPNSEQISGDGLNNDSYRAPVGLFVHRTRRYDVFAEFEGDGKRMEIMADSAEVVHTPLADVCYYWCVGQRDH